MHAMILAAGLGTRLRPLTDELPKPLMPIGDEPAIARIIRRFSKAGFRDVTVNAHHLAAEIDRAIEGGLGSADGVAVRAVHEATILGTAGGVANMARSLGATRALVWNGDILSDLDVRALVQAHGSSRSATLAVAPRTRGEGTIGIGAAGQIVRLRGESFGDEARGGDFIGVQAIGEDLIPRLPAEGCLVGDVYLPALRRGETIATFDAPNAWDDIGTIDAYVDANLAWLAARGLTSFVHPAARIGRGVSLDGTIVGASAVVDDGLALSRCVVWPGARALHSADREVISHGRGRKIE